MQIPISTYRLQFNRDFRFVDALRLVDYLHELGITHVYASPVLTARPGSPHGYDVIDPTQINPELGTPEEFDRFVEALHSKKMGLILDIVPNHMAASLDNPWWFDVLEKGEESAYAGFFDVNWQSRKVLLPILARPYGEVLENHELAIQIDKGRPVVQYHEQKLPIAAGAENLNVDDVLSRQHYRLTYWKKAADGTNYRRFFDVNDLVGLHAECEDVFQATHAAVLKLVEEGKVSGLRIDHIDGLLDPSSYLERLPNMYAVVEKILSGNEQLRPGWRVQGTTGYDFLNFVNSAFIDCEGFHKLEKIYSGFTASHASLWEVWRERKRQVMGELFAGEVTALAHRLTELAEDDRHARDLTNNELTSAFIAVTACLPAYRTYIRDFTVDETDRACIEDAIAAAGKGPAFDFLRRILLLEPAWYLQHRKGDYLDFVMRWQQFTGPVMAKGLEDTAFYIHNPLISVNEVGGDPNGPEASFGVEAFHRHNLERHSNWPDTMNASSTHDTKRSEDVRARINVLSELPAEWERSLLRWNRWNKSETAPDRNEQILIYQTMLGAWPIASGRLQQYVIKALREGKTHSSWININEEYEGRVLSFIDSLYSNAKFLGDFSRFEKKIAFFGALSSLSQLVLKITSPGIPDFYQGAELWDLSLADPDNRRPVDFDARIGMLASLGSGPDPNELLQHWSDGRLKLYLTQKLLNIRREHDALFREGEYVPLRTGGVRATHVIAFARRLREQCCVVAVPRLYAALTRAGAFPIGKRVWRDTWIELPSGARLGAAKLFEELPVAVVVD